MASVILLNGPGSSGKSSTARALQAVLSGPFLHVAMDGFLDMLPEPLQDHPDGVAYLPGKDGTRVALGPVGHRLIAGMRAAVAALAGAGNDLIVDDVLSAEGIADYRQRLQGHRLLVAGLSTPLPVLEAREAARGDRMAGLARDQVRWVAIRDGCDLTLDTSTATPADLAQRIAWALSDAPPV
jgi:chloramphenicol 3-O phosphotransferase